MFGAVRAQRHRQLRWFKLKSKEECWFYHDLAANKTAPASAHGWPSLYDKAQPLYLEKITTLKKSYGREDSRCENVVVLAPTAYGGAATGWE
ncbi:hypothetical protein Tco_0634001 [Tanacetum coccineum]